jgi:TonB family protein
MVGWWVLMAVVPSFAASAVGQPQGQQFNDCWITKRGPSFAIEATADGVAPRFDRNPDASYPERARRMRKTGDVSLRCYAVADRPTRCIVADQSNRSFDLGAPALAVMKIARLSAPSGAWPLDIDVRFRQSGPGDPTLVPCS